MRRVVVLPALLLLLLTGCAGRAGEEPVPSSSPSSSAAAPGGPVAAALVNGFWRVHDAEGESSATWLQLTAGGLTVFRPRGFLLGEWEGQGDAVAMSLSGWSMSLGDDHDAPWLRETATVAADGDGWVLLDVDGRTTARLTREGRPPESTQILIRSTPAGPSASTLRDAVPGARATTVPASAIRGTWRLAGFRDATLTFAADGRWSTRTTCDSGSGGGGGAGAYRVLGGGLLLMTQGPVAGVGCSDAASPSPDAAAVGTAGSARSFAVADDRLTLYDGRGDPLGTLVR